MQGASSIDEQDAKAKGRGGARAAFAAFVVAACALCAGCAPAPVRVPAPGPPRPTPAPEFAAAPEAALPALVAAERRAAAGRDLALLATLWAEDARVVEARGTADPADDYRWEGRAAVLDRYVTAVFPNPPPDSGPPAFDSLTVEGDGAAAAAGVDRWRFVFADGRWWLAELVIAP